MRPSLTIKIGSLAVIGTLIQYCVSITCLKLEKILDQPEHPFQGARGAKAGHTAAEITNAVFDATGLRLGRIPFKAENFRGMAISEKVAVKEV